MVNWNKNEDLILKDLSKCKSFKEIHGWWK